MEPHCQHDVTPGCGCQRLAERGKFLLACAGVLISVSAFVGGLVAGLIAR